MKARIEEVIEGIEIPKNLLNAENYLKRFTNIEQLLKDTVDKSRSIFNDKDILKCIEIICERYNIKFLGVDNVDRIVFRDNENTHRLYISILSFTTETIEALKNIRFNIMR